MQYSLRQLVRLGPATLYSLNQFRPADLPFALSSALAMTALPCRRGSRVPCTPTVNMMGDVAKPIKVKPKHPAEHLLAERGERQPQPPSHQPKERGDHHAAGYGQPGPKAQNLHIDLPVRSLTEPSQLKSPTTPAAVQGWDNSMVSIYHSPVEMRPP